MLYWLMNRITDKPWGREVLLTDPQLPYTAKIISVNQGQRLSLQYHDQKTETITLISGQAKITLGSSLEALTDVDMEPLRGYTILPGTIHRITAITDTQLFEASTVEIGTTYRLQDDFQRQDEILSE
jgi:mannose-6-phosphate isomerase-like protein (cupin superfamily)